MIRNQVSARIVEAGERNITRAAQLLREGRLVAFPTETVYGLGADARNDHAVASLFAAKGRPRFNPLIIHVRNRDEAAELAVFNSLAASLANAFWPGGLTLVLPRRGGVKLSSLASAGLETVAIRSPAHPVARALLDATGLPIAAPSANRAGRISPTRAADVADELQDRVALVLDGGPCAIGIESTVIGFADGRAVLLRPGAIAREELEKLAGPLQTAGRDIQGPGMMASHYAPRARVRLNATTIEPGEALLAFGRDIPSGAGQICNLSEASDLQEAAANLFAMLRQLDGFGAETIAVMPIPNRGLGQAINDRLARAAAPRD